jgi:hypothetical protein
VCRTTVCPVHNFPPPSQLLVCCQPHRQEVIPAQKSVYETFLSLPVLLLDVCVLRPPVQPLCVSVLQYTLQPWTNLFCDAHYVYSTCYTVACATLNVRDAQRHVARTPNFFFIFVNCAKQLIYVRDDISTHPIFLPIEEMWNRPRKSPARQRIHVMRRVAAKGVCKKSFFTHTP